MEDSVLISTKKILGLGDEYNVYDLDIITFINSVFDILNQLGIGNELGHRIEDRSMNWSDLSIPPQLINLVKTYMFLKVRLLFDPPTLSFHLDLYKNQITEYEWRLTNMRDYLLSTTS